MHDATVSWRVIDDIRPLSSGSRRAAFPVDEAIVDAYQRDGVVHLPSAFPEWVDALRAGLDRNIASPDAYAYPSDNVGGNEPGRFFESYCNWQRIPEYLTFVLTSGAASLAAALMRSESAQLFHEHSFAKERGTRKATPWHQDLPYYCVDGSQTASIYVALDAAPAATAPRFVRGSHLWGETFRPRRFADGGDYPTPDPSASAVPEIAESSPDIIVSSLEPGDALAFDFRTLHGSTDAAIEHRRRAFSTRWLGDDVTYRQRPNPTSPPLADLGLEPGQRMRPDWFPVLWE